LAIGVVLARALRWHAGGARVAAGVCLAAAFSFRFTDDSVVVAQSAAELTRGEGGGGVGGDAVQRQRRLADVERLPPGVVLVCVEPSLRLRNALTQRERLHLLPAMKSDTPSAEPPSWSPRKSTVFSFARKSVTLHTSSCRCAGSAVRRTVDSPGTLLPELVMMAETRS